jgi:hypothetical protein
LSRVLWLVPFAVHLAYLLATSRELPAAFGARPWAADAGVSMRLFLVEWLTIVAVANAALAAVHIRLPRFGDRLLSVPQKELWLSSPALRGQLVERLRGFLETALLLLNVFFLAVYQRIYQSNVAAPTASLPEELLVVGFMVVPLFLIVLAFVRLVVGLRAQAGDAPPPPREGVDG